MLASTLSKDTPFGGMHDGIALALSRAIIDTVRDPLLVLDQNQRIVAASRSFYQTFKLDGHELRGSLIFDIDGGQWDIPELRELLGTIAKDRETIEGYEVDREFPVIGRRIMLLNVRKVFYEEGTHGTVLLAFEDITDRRGIERQLEELMREKEKPDAAILVTSKIADTDWKLTISDNGVGKSEPSTSQKKGGLGTSLLQALAKQLDARVDTESDSRGTAVSITYATFKPVPASARIH